MRLLRKAVSYQYILRNDYCQAGMGMSVRLAPFTAMTEGRTIISSSYRKASQH